MTLKEFCTDLLRYVGTGYKYYKISIVPQEKLYLKEIILNKIKTLYKTDLTQGQKQHRRLKGIANYASISYKEFIIVLHTDGENNDGANEFKLLEKNMILPLTQHLGLILFKDERNIWTFRLSTETYQNFKGQFQLAFKHNDGKKFHSLQKLWSGLPRYKGIGSQRKDLNKLLKELKKTYQVKWSLR